MAKLGTFAGVFIPTTLNVLSILLYLRYGFMLGQLGVVGMIGTLCVSYAVNLLTTLSISAISTNGTVRGGGTYYMISRSLGPEFGGSIGIVFYLGQVFNAAMNIAGFCEPLMFNFNSNNARMKPILPEGRWWEFAYSSILLLICTTLSAVGSNVFSNAGYILFCILAISVLSIMVSAVFRSSFYIPGTDLFYTGLNWSTFKENFLPNFTSGAAGSDIAPHKENFRHLFGIFFPSTAGIFAGASMSGQLKDPSRSIPKGTLWGLLTTFVVYFLVIIFMGASIPRQILYEDVQVLQTVALSKTIILLGELSTSLFSAIVGIVGAANVLAAVSKDRLLGDNGYFAKENASGPFRAIIMSFVICQITLFFDINQIAGLITMSFLLTFLITNLACFLLKISSAPNFRPLFRWFNWETAFAGAIASFVAMYICDGATATAAFGLEMFLFFLIHMFSPPKPWGDVSQTLIYHQVRKYLLRLRQDHVKFWRPQILLFVDEPRTCWNLILFCNALKKGSLYVLGHAVIIKREETDSDEWYKEINFQRNCWTKLRDLSKIKAFIQVLPAPSLVWGVRDIALSSGLGGMKPNIAILGFFETRNQYLRKKSHHTTFSQSDNSDSMATGTAATAATAKSNSSKDTILDVSPLPTDYCRTENPAKVTEWVEIIESLLKMRLDIAIAKGFPNLEIPRPVKKFPWSRDTNLHGTDLQKKYIDLWPIQMSAQVFDPTREMNVMTTNFDTYSLILQMGQILHSVHAWNRAYKLRVIVFVEFREDVVDESTRIKELLRSLRIRAHVIVLCLSELGLNSYNCIVRGAKDASGKIDRILSDVQWWKDCKIYREKAKRDTQSRNSDGFIKSSVAVSRQRSIQSQLQRPSHIMRRKSILNSQVAAGSLQIQTQMLPNADLIDSSADEDEDDEFTDEDYYNHNFDKTDADSIASDVDSRAASDSDFVPQENIKSKRDIFRIFRNRVMSVSESEYHDEVPPITISRATGKHTSTRPSRSGSRVSLTNSRRSMPMFSSDTIPTTTVNADCEDGVNPTISFSQTVSRHQSNENIKDGEAGIKSEQSSLLSKNESVTETAQYQATKTTSEDVLLGTHSRSSSKHRPAEKSKYYGITFNEVPAIAQHIILNEAMHSLSDDTAVIFSTLPLPLPGTGRRSDDSLAYVSELSVLCDQLPPILLMHSQSVTVTAAL
ncbi:hypothetical protein CANCADRAFT_30856 [Tortispora caseinolytica NRRL Y-17796]|uniref:Amino acid permease/ SLC12A domain-containing protein n=1 Tax=Tortispora caseinolytica NRRL Y-17796 TaxID=767744 RepID=A0A1E4TM59_9ASCO|nr:hypothetical protein CANCADRAFT_30856 [Tortispora caseinolytica NRRL Y-17796]